MPSVGRVHYELSSDGRWQAHASPPNDDEQLIVVSQDCDIRSERERFVETMPCYWVLNGTAEFTAARRGNSGRFFFLKQDGSGKNRRAQIVDATDRVQIAKLSLEHLTPTLAVPSENSDSFYRRLRPWLGGRYSRIPLDPDVVEFVQRPISKLMTRLGNDHKMDPNAIVREIRIAPLRDPAPFELDMMIVVTDATSVSDERVASLVGAISELFGASPDVTSLRQCTPYTTEEITVYDYERTWKMPLDYLSWHGEEETGSLPLGGIDYD